MKPEAPRFQQGLSVGRTCVSVPLGAVVTGAAGALGQACARPQRCTPVPSRREVRGVGTRAQTPVAHTEVPGELRASGPLSCAVSTTWGQPDWPARQEQGLTGETPTETHVPLAPGHGPLAHGRLLGDSRCRAHAAPPPLTLPHRTSFLVRKTNLFPDESDGCPSPESQGPRLPDCPGLTPTRCLSGTFPLPPPTHHRKRFPMWVASSLLPPCSTSDPADRADTPAPPSQRNSDWRPRWDARPSPRLPVGRITRASGGRGDGAEG